MSILRRKHRGTLKCRNRGNYFKFLEALEERTLLSFTIAVMPDAQYMTATRNEEFAAETAWIKSQQSALNIQFAVDLGDIVDHGNQYAADWNDAVTAMDNIAAMNIPFGVVQGNHDHDNWYTHPDPIGTWLATGTTASNAHFGPSTSFFNGKTWYGSMTAASGYYDSGGTDSYQKFTADGQTFLNLCLEDEPSDEALAWATAVMNANPGIPVILSTHQGTNPNGSFVGLEYHTRTSPYETDTPSPGNGAQAVWNWVAQHDDRIFLWLCGHEAGTTDSNGWATADNLQSKTGSHGNPVWIQLTDYQGNQAGPDGAFQLDPGAEWVRTMTFDLTARTITEHTFSPAWNAYSYQLPGLYGVTNPFDEPVSSSDFTIDFSNAPQVPTQSGTAVVSIGKSGTPSETGPVSGTYTLSRTGSTTSSLTVDVSMSGTATNGTDYTTIGNTVTFAAGSATKTVTLTPIDDGLAEPIESAIMTINAGTGYTIGSPSSAELDILDNDSGTLAAYDGFNYTVGTGSNLAGHDTGTGLGGNWTVSNTTNVNVDSGSLSYSSAGHILSTSGNSVQATSYASATGTLGQSIGTLGTTTWVGFEFASYSGNPAESIQGDLDLNPSAGAGTGLRLGTPSNGLIGGRIDVGSYDGYISTSITAVANQTYFIVASIQYLSTGDIINLYVNPTPGTTPTTPTATKTLSSSVTLPVGSTFILYGPQESVATFDEIRIGTSYSFVAPENTSQIPNAPSALTVTPSGSNLNLAWTDNSTNETGFHVYRSTNDVTFTVVHSTAANVASWTDNTVTSGTTYYYYVTAYNATGESSKSNTATNGGSGLIAYDGFNYTVGDGTNWDNQSGGSGFTSAWTLDSPTDSAVIAGNLNVSGLTETGNTAQLSDSSSATRTVNTTFGTDDTSLWVGFVINQNLGGNSGGLDSALWIGSDPSNHIELGSPWNGFYDGQAFIGGSRKYWNGTGIAPVSGDNVFLVYRIDFGHQAGNTSPDKILLWVNPTPGTQPSDASATTTWTLPTGTYFAFTDNNIKLDQSSYWNQTEFDELRLGSDYNDVAPATVVNPTVTLAATTASAAEDGPSGPVNGVFTVTRTGSTASALTVNYTISGTATNGTDYTTLGTSVTIAAGASSATITLTPKRDDVPESTETAILTLASGTGYTTGSPSSGTVNIADNGLLVYDGFNYTVGGGTNWNGQGGGAGWTNNWTVNDTTNSGIASGSLAYTSGTHALITSGNQAYLHDSNGATRTANYTFGQDNTSLWVGFEMNQHLSGGTGSLNGGIQLSSDANNMLQLGSPWNGYYDGQAYIGGTRYYMHGETGANPVAVVDNTPVFLVYRIDFSATGTADTLRLWVNPVPGTQPTDASANFTYTLPAGVNFAFTNNDVRLRDSTYYNMATYDELRLGTTYYSVAPDPIVLPTTRPSIAFTSLTDFSPIVSSGRTLTITPLQALDPDSIGLSVNEERPGVQAPLAGARRPDASTNPTDDGGWLKGDVLFLPGME